MRLAHPLLPALLLGGSAAAPAAADGSSSLAANPSPGVSLLLEASVTALGSSTSSKGPPLRIRSDVPLTVHRYTDVTAYVGTDGPVPEGRGRVLVTSDCDTGSTTVVPRVRVFRGGTDDDGATVLEVTLGADGDDGEGEGMPFLPSSSYEATWRGAGGCRQNPPFPPPPPPPTPLDQAEFELFPCPAEEACDAARTLAKFDSYKKGPYPTKGCFSKNGVAYWGTGGTPAQRSREVLPGVQRRVWCRREVDPPAPAPGDGDGDGDDDGLCRDEAECRRAGMDLGIDTFNAGNYPTHGCFVVKRGDAPSSLFWGRGGTPADRAREDLPGIRKRVFCGRDDKGGGGSVSEEGGCDDNGDCGEFGIGAGEGGGGRAKKFCRRRDGCEKGESRGTCGDVPDACIEVYRPVCGCDGTTYSNRCKAHGRGTNVLREGRCDVCRTKEDCEAQVRGMGIKTVNVGDFPNKGCFVKKDKAYFSPGSDAEMSQDDLPVQQKRVWCGGEEARAASSALQQRTDSHVLREENAASGALSLRPLAFGALLRNVLSARASPPPRSRALDTCSYNVEVLLYGCANGAPADVEVAAPKARVIESETKDQKREELTSGDTRHTASLVFPDGRAAIVPDAAGDAYAKLPTSDDGRCAPVVCGRPFVDSGGNGLLASPFAADRCGGDSSWSGEAASPAAAKNGTRQDALGEEWTKNALGEHASVASFAAFSIALMSNQAPSHLVEDSLKAALDEVRHAKTSFDIASKLAGKLVGPGPLPPSSHDFSQNLTSLAMAVAKEGCVDETLSALGAAAEAELIDEALKNGAADGTKYSGIDGELLVWIRNELRTISMDEGGHSALAWRTLNWVCATDADACNAATQGILDENKLNAAFQLHFGRRFKGNPELINRMSEAWVNIYTHQNVLTILHPNEDSDVIGGPACVDGVVEEDHETDPPTQSLLTILVENISLGVTK